MIYESAAGPEAQNDIGKRQPLDVKVGNRVLFAKYGGTWIYNNTRRSILMVILFQADAPGISGVFDLYWARR
jgi:co-chaperonin GroES (HSP10)